MESIVRGNKAPPSQEICPPLKSAIVVRLPNVKKRMEPRAGMLTQFVITPSHWVYKQIVWYARRSHCAPLLVSPDRRGLEQRIADVEHILWIVLLCQLRLPIAPVR